MPRVIYVDSAGCRRAIEGAVGDSIMTIAVQNGVPGIIGECGGNRSCATCHVWIREGFRELAGPPNDLEEDLLDLGVSDRRDGSRLSCQIVMTEALDGLTVDVPPGQP